MLLSGKHFWLTFFSMITGTLVLGQILFSFGGWEVPWFFGALGVGVTSLTVFLYRYSVMERKNIRIRDALEGLVSPQLIETLMARPDRLKLKPSGQIITVMFIDIVSFYLAAERQSPSEVFRTLKALMEMMTETIHRHGGVVDKTMGDGLLCFFGYHYDGRERPQHADDALACAIDLQREAVKHNLHVAKNGGAVYPLRIGINTGNAYVGDLGNAFRLDFTIIGHVINYAKRLETACDDYCVMVGATTKDLLSRRGTHLVRRQIQIKHYEELMEAYECNPFEDDATEKNAAIKAYREFQNIERRDHRWPIPHEVLIEVECGRSRGRLLNFSRLGFAIELDSYLGRSVSLELQLDSADRVLGKVLQQCELHRFLGEVRWGRPASRDGYFLHGFQLKNLTDRQSEKLLEALRTELSRQNGPLLRKVGR